MTVEIQCIFDIRKNLLTISSATLMASPTEHIFAEKVAFELYEFTEPFVKKTNRVSEGTQLGTSFDIRSTAITQPCIFQEPIKFCHHEPKQPNLFFVIM